jgi:AraC-like DNA-binding protein
VNRKRASVLARVPSAMGLVARLAHEQARSRRLATASLLAEAGLTTRQIEDSQARLPVRNQIEFLNLVADALGDDMLGFHLAQDFELRRCGLFFYVLVSSERLCNLFERGARFSSTVNEGVLHEYIEDRRMGLRVRYRGVKRQTDRHQIEFWLATLVRICRRGTGAQIKPVRVRFSHYREKDRTALSRFMGCDVEFGADADEILFTREDGNLPIVNSDPYLNKLLVEVSERNLARQHRAVESLAARIENAVAPLLPHGVARAGRIAAELGMSERTLARRLADEGLTFSRLVDRLRLELARRYLLEEGLSISKVAWLLGYKEAGAFSHAYRRWTGKSPSETVRRGR